MIARSPSLNPASENVPSAPVVVCFMLCPGPKFAALLVPFAHFGHVLVDLPIFFGPVAVLSLWILLVSRKDRRRPKGR